MKSMMSAVEAPGVKTSATPELLELGDVLRRDRPADGDHHVVRVLLAQQLDDARHERHVRARQDREPDGVGVLLDDGLDDLLGRLVQPGVDDLHPRVAQRAGDDLRAAVVAVEARLGDDDADPAGGGGGGHVRIVTRHGRAAPQQAQRTTSFIF